MRRLSVSYLALLKCLHGRSGFCQVFCVTEFSFMKPCGLFGLFTNVKSRR